LTGLPLQSSKISKIKNSYLRFYVAIMGNFRTTPEDP